MSDLLTAEALAEIQKRLDDPHNQGGMQSTCGEYECDCHQELPALLAHVAAMQAELEEITERCNVYTKTLADHYEIDATECKSVTDFRQRAVAAVRALTHNSEVESARWNQAITEAVAKIQQLPATTTEDGK